ncbi:unnamed protein product [Mucor hiemalis]
MLLNPTTVRFTQLLLRSSHSQHHSDICFSMQRKMDSSLLPSTIMASSRPTATISDSRAPDNNNALFEGNDPVYDADSNDKGDIIKIKKTKLPLDFDCIDAQIPFKLTVQSNFNEFLDDQLNLDNLSALDNDAFIERLFVQLKETDILKNYFAEDQLKLFINNYITNHKRSELYSDITEELPTELKDIVSVDDEPLTTVLEEEVVMESLEKTYEITSAVKTFVKEEELPVYTNITVSPTKQKVQANEVSLNMLKGYNKDLRANTENSCFIDAIFEMLWHSVLPSVENLLRSGIDKNNSYDTILLRSYNFHRLNTYYGRNQASYIMREFIWKKKICARGRGAFGDCSEIFENFFSNMSEGCITFCEFQKLYRFKLCSRDVSHSGYSLRNKTPLKVKCSLEEALFEYKESQCRKCTVELGEESSDLPGVLTHCNIVENAALPPFYFVTDPQNLVYSSNRLKSNFPYTVKVGADSYILHARIYSTGRSDDHFFSVVKVTYSNITFVAKLDNLRPQIQVLTLDPSQFEKPLSKSENSVIVCYKK